MGETARGFRLRRRESEQEQVRQALMDGVTQTRHLIAQAYGGFNDTSDPDLIDSYVFEINALQARHSYLLRQLKQLEGEA